jgi:hypothetical protein
MRLMLIVVALLVALVSPALAATTHRCAAVETGERRVFEIRATGATCRTARRVARVGWQVSPRGWRCTVNESTLRYRCTRRHAVITFKAIGSD